MRFVRDGPSFSGYEVRFVSSGAVGAGRRGAVAGRSGGLAQHGLAQEQLGVSGHYGQLVGAVVLDQVRDTLKNAVFRSDLQGQVYIAYI